MKPVFAKPRYELTSPAGWTLFLGLLLFILYLALPRGESVAWWVLALPVVYLVIGAGAWMEQRWATECGKWVFLVFGLLRVLAIGQDIAGGDFRWSSLGYLILAGFLAWEYHQSLRLMSQDEEDGKPLISLVLLLSRPRYLEAPILAEILEECWGDRFTSTEEDAPEFVVGDSPTFAVKSSRGMFLVHNFSTPYWEDTGTVAEEIAELRLRQALLDHQAWLSVDLLSHFDESIPLEAYYDLIIRAIVELADEEDTLAVHRPDTGQLNIWNDDVFENLVRPGGIDQFNSPVEPSVLEVEEGDPLMEAAVQEARDRWPEFQEAFLHREKDDSFLVKAPITSGGNTEFIWIEVSGLEPDFIHGQLGNEPIDLGSLKLGSTVEVPLSDLNDWVYHRKDQEPVGLFTVQAVEEAQKRRQAGDGDE